MGFSCSLRALCCGVWALWVESSASRAGLISYCMGLVGYSTQNLNSPTRDQACVPCIGMWILNYWTTREALWTLLRMQYLQLRWATKVYDAEP